MSVKHIFEPAHTESYYNQIRLANTEQAKKERFLQYLTLIYSGDQQAQKIINGITLGAERIIAKIPRGGIDKKGRADTQTETIIIEWEKDLAKTGEHAIEQLTEYLIGNWRSGQDYRFVLIATDGIRWRIYAPEWATLASSLFDLSNNLKLREVRRFDLTLEPDKVNEFPFFLDELLFISVAKIATLKNIQCDFGDTSSAFLNSIRVLSLCAGELKTKSELKVAFDQWRRFLSIAYGRFDDSPTMFLVHTYLSVFAKLLAYAVISKKQIQDDDVLRSVLNGSIFKKYNIERFVEDDFFCWVAMDPYFKQLKPMFRELNSQISEYDYTEVEEDILKGIYQEMIDLDTRHALGEYFTPDWLCEKIVGEIPISPNFRILDPACGSGSFLRAVIARLRQEYPSIKADKIASHVVGIDIHPLSVQIAKTTILLGLGDLIVKAREPVTLHIYLANSLLVPQGTAGLFQSTFKVSVDNALYSLDITGLTEPEDYDKIITLCDELVDRYEELLTKERFLKIVDHALTKDHSVTLPQELYEIYKGMKCARDEGRDSIWKFILQNTYKPVFLQNTFDIVVGNPPWLTYADVSNAEYQQLLRLLADGYHVTSERRANMPNLEIAAIFLAHSVNYFLKADGIIAFVLPRSFMTADQHENTRSGSISNVKLTSLWDLKDVEPLFRVPSCVIFAKHGKPTNPLPEHGIPGYVIEGKLRNTHLHLTEASRLINSKKTVWYYSKLQSGKKRTRSALMQTLLSGESGRNAYADRFIKGADIFPRCFYFVEVDQELKSASLRNRVIHVKTSSIMKRDAKLPWKNISLSGRIESKYLYLTAVAKNILPFALINPPLVVLPVTTAKDEEEKNIFSIHDSDELLEHGAIFTSKWFLEAEKLWNKYRTEANQKKEVTLTDWLNWQHKLSRQDPDAKYVVIYTSSAQDASAVVVNREQFELPFVVDHTAYLCKTKTLAEAYYLCGFLNSGFANEQIKEFQARGLFGARHIHKTIVKIPFPKYDPKNEDHRKISNLSEKCSHIVTKIMGDDSGIDLDARALGRMRTSIRRQLESELEEIDVLVESLSTGKAEATVRTFKKGRKHRRGSESGILF